MVRRGVLIRDAIASVLVGAVVTVLVAWSLALHADSRAQPLVSEAPWPAATPAGWPQRAKYATAYTALWAGGGLWQWSAWGNLNGGHSGDFHMFVSRSGWPLAAMESTLRTNAIDRQFWDAADGPYDNDGTLGAGLIVPLHRTRPQEAGGNGWCPRRLPMRPLPLGFLANTAIAAGGSFGLFVLWRFQPSHSDRTGGWPRPRLGHPACIVLLGALLSVVVSFALWCRWQFTSTPLGLASDWLRPGVSVAQNATRLPGILARWPAAVPGAWPAKPTWIGWHGEAPGVRAYELTSRGVPSACVMWIHVSWAPGAFDHHQSMHVVQMGWPMPCFQSEELLWVPGRAPPLKRAANPKGRAVDEPSPIDPDAGPLESGEALPRDIRNMFPAQEPLERAGAIWNVTLPGSPRPQSASTPAPLVPIRPLALGMATNTLLFSAAIAPLILMPGAIRTLRRRRAGLCLRCGYEVLNLLRCPECRSSSSVVRASAPAVLSDRHVV